MAWNGVKGLQSRVSCGNRARYRPNASGQLLYHPNRSRTISRDTSRDTNEAA